jgi:hypothetical protein
VRGLTGQLTVSEGVGIVCAAHFKGEREREAEKAGRKKVNIVTDVTSGFLGPDPGTRAKMDLAISATTHSAFPPPTDKLQTVTTLGVVFF